MLVSCHGIMGTLWKTTRMKASALLNTAALLLQLLPAATSSPVDQSGCKVIWLFRSPCTEPAGAIVNQVKDWSQKNCSDSQEKCMYEVIKESPTSLKIKHTSPSTHKTTDITFYLNPPSFCKIVAFSTSKSKNATGPNDYCLLYNLIDGSGLTEAQGYKEICNDVMCPAKEAAPCNTEG